MFFSGYLSLYLLQFLNMKLSQTKLIQRAYTTIDGLIDDALFPENGPVFMQRLHEVHPERRSSGEKIQRRFGDTYAPETEQTIEAFNDRVLNNPAYDYPVSTETPIQLLHQNTGYMPIFDNSNLYNKDNTMQGHNVSLINVYDDYTAIETTVQNVDGNHKYKTMKTNVINALNPSARNLPILFEPNGPTFTPKMYDEYPIASKSSTQGFDFLMDGPDFNLKLYDENSPISTEKSIQRYNEPLYEPSFTFPKFDGTAVQKTKIKKTTPIFNKTVLKKIADVFYPELKTTAKRSHRTRKGRINPRSRFTNPITSKTTIQRLVGAQKRKPAFIQKSGDALKETTKNIPLLNYLAFMQEQRNPRTRDTTIQRFIEPLRNGPVLIPNYDVNFPKTETTTQRSHRTRKHKPRLKHPRKTKILRFDGPLKHAPQLEAKDDEVNYPPASETTNFMENHDLNSILTETAIQRLKRPLSNELSFIQRRQQNPTIRDKTIQRSNEPLRNGPDFIQNFDVNLPTTETTIQRSDTTLEFEAKMNEDKYAPVLETTDLSQNLELNSLKIETASQPLRGSPKNKPIFKKEMHETYAQKYETTIQRLKKPLNNGPDFFQEANEDYPPALVTTGFRQNHYLYSLRTEPASQQFRETQEHNPIFKKVMDVTYPHKNETTTKGLKKSLRNGPDFDKKVNANYYPPTLKTTDFRQNHDFKSPKIETALQPLRETSKHKPTFIKKMHETYPQKYETTVERLRKPIKNGLDFDPKVNVNYYPPPLETTGFRQNHYSPKIETASQPLHGTPKYKPTFIKEMHETYPQKSKTTIKGLKKPLRNGPDFDTARQPLRGTSKHKPTFVKEMHETYPQKSETAIKGLKKPLRNEPDFVTARQPLRGTSKHKPTFVKEMHETYSQKSETIIQRLKKPLKNGPDFDQKISVNYYPPPLETTGFRQNHYSPKIETASQPLRGTPKHKPTFIKEMHETYPQESEMTNQGFKKPLRNGLEFEQKVNEDYPPALQNSPTFIQRFDVTVPHSGNYKVQRLHITPSLPHASISFVDPLSNLNPSFRPKLKPEIQKPYTMTNLVSPAYIRSTATRNPAIAETGLVYPWIKTAYPPGSNLESIVLYSPVTTREVFRETSKSYYVPSTTLDYEVKPQVLRAPMLEPTRLNQETYIDGTTQDPMLAENFAPKQDSPDQAESSDPEEDDHTLAESSDPKEDDQTVDESSDPKEDDHTLAESSESEEDESIKLKEEFRGLTEKIGLKQEAADVVEGEGTDPFSTFLRKLVRVLASKNMKELRNLIQPFGRYVTSLVDSGKLMKLGVSTGSFIAQSTPLLHGPLNQIKRHLFIAQVSLENRRRMLDDGTNTLLDEMDDVYDAGEEEAMQRILREIAMYPNTSRSEEEIVKDLVDEVFLHPMHRMAGTTQGNVVFEYIGKFCNKFQYARRNERPEQHTIIGPITVSEDKGISTKNYIGSRGITRTEVRKITFKHDISTRIVQTSNSSDSFSSDDSKYSSGERSQLEIRIRINRGKHYHEDKICKSRKNCVKIKKANFSKINTIKKTKEYTLVGNTGSEKSEKVKLEPSKTENKENTGKNKTTVKVKLDCKHLPVILSDKRVGKGNGTGDPLTEMIMFCSNDKEPDGSDEVSKSSDTGDSDTSSDR